MMWGFSYFSSSRLLAPKPSPQQCILLLVSEVIILLFLFYGCMYLYLIEVAEVIFAITSAVKDVCKSPLTERHFLDRYGKVCLCLDEIVWKGYLENTDKDRVGRLIKLRPPLEP